MKSYSKALDVDRVQTSCKFLVGIEMYVLRDTIKNKHFYFKKIRNLVTEWRRKGNFFFWHKAATEFPVLFPSLMAMDFAFRCHPALPIFPTKKSMSQFLSLNPSPMMMKFRNSVVRYSVTSENPTTVFCRQFHR